MAENSKIEWTDHTFNPWWGCTKISVGPQGACEHCYAESLAKRVGYPHLWDGMRRTFGEKHWREPLKWDEQAQLQRRRFRVFCASMADVFDNDAPPGERERLWGLIQRTPHLDWLLLTKRIGNAGRMLPPEWLEKPRTNVWFGATLATRAEMLRDAPKLRALPAAIIFWSVEPMLGDFGEIPRELLPDWVIAGGESGALARPPHPDWLRSLRDQCATVGVAFHFKQWGEWVPMLGHTEGVPVSRKHTHADGTIMGRAGKKAAGRLLEGRVWDQFPQRAT